MTKVSTSYRGIDQEKLAQTIENAIEFMKLYPPGPQTMEVLERILTTYEQHNGLPLPAAVRAAKTDKELRDVLNVSDSQDDRPDRLMGEIHTYWTYHGGVDTDGIGRRNLEDVYAWTSLIGGACTRQADALLHEVNHNLVLHLRKEFTLNEKDCEKLLTIIKARKSTYGLEETEQALYDATVGLANRKPGGEEAFAALSERSSYFMADAYLKLFEYYYNQAGTACASEDANPRKIAEYVAASDKANTLSTCSKLAVAVNKALGPYWRKGEVKDMGAPAKFQARSKRDKYAMVEKIGVIFNASSHAVKAIEKKFPGVTFIKYPSR